MVKNMATNHPKSTEKRFTRGQLEKLEKLSRLTPKQFKDLNSRILLEFIAGFVEDGSIDPNRGEKGILEDVRKLVKHYEVVPIADHTGSLLKHARKMQREDNSEIASVFYATWIEHQLNKFIFRFATRKGFLPSDIESIIRDSSIKVKTTWLLPALDGKVLSPRHVKRISKLMEFRNSYLHYKWKPVQKEREFELEDILNEIESTIQYLLKYEKKHLNRVTLRQVKKLMNRQTQKTRTQ